MTQFECPRRAVSDPVVESGSCNWCYNNNKKKPQPCSSPWGCDRRMRCLLPRRPPEECVSCPSLFVRLTGSEQHCLWARVSLPDPQLSRIPLCIARNGSQTEQSSGFQIRMPCKQSIPPPPTPKQNMLSQLAWVTRIPNRPCMYVCRPKVNAGGGRRANCLCSSLTGLHYLL